ncbi:MAG: MmgE/PrpD family protein [Betaproteobacteria bacterium]|nr:MmgE/PrpD family protein [Betaproteobacteria bacterium]
MINGNAGYNSLNDEALQNPAIAALRHRVHMTEDPALTAKVPALKPARVTLTLKDGRKSTHECDTPRGDCLNPYSAQEIREKFRELAAPTLTAAGIAAIEQAVDRCEQWTSARELADLLRRHGRA